MRNSSEGREGWVILEEMGRSPAHMKKVCVCVCIG